MFEARHSMDAPTTTSADNGTSGGGGGGGWFTPHTPPDPPAGGEQGATEGRRLAALRPVGRSAAGAGGPAQRRIPPKAQAGPDTDRTGAERSGADRSGAVRTDAARTGPGPGSDLGPGSGSGPKRVPGESEGTARAVSSAPPMASRAVTPPAATLNGPPPTARTAVAAPTVPTARSAPAPDSVPAAATPAPATPASPDAVLIRRTMAEVAPVADKVTSYFYALLFVRHPDLRPLFPAAMDTQRDRLLKALLTAAEHIDNTDVLVSYLQNLGRGHRKYGTRPEHYPAVGECLLGALSRFAEEAWDGETEAAWVRAYTKISQVMIDAAAADELRAPAWWYAEVVSHELRTPDVAVVTVRPDQPYPFLAGQYASLETPWWPRVWRHYSFASAPRSDGLLSFHVKAVPAGWVSSALVHRARPGDTVRLGPPAGSMTVDHTTDSGLLCLGGGTGIAPIKALVEDVAEHGQRRPVEVFYGARTGHDLYDIDTMLRLQQSHSWLAVRPIVDQQAHLQLPDAVREYGPWDEYDAYLSGPPGMIRNGVDALRDIGIPSARIRHDAVEDLVAARD
ncbi:globin domain-containing protein [Streptomyces sp. A15ISP2-DRY2]|uniref:nitric oxide dioxygenase n=2 Tax=Streptomyces ortus TaxID=2867268 RepID=A0ABT3V633_9ACTN|nr:globin domain-containing protein [Streptomyces ortus]MCX4235462.1 globin domain-containing protein [Streptomyces ortus]